MTMAVRSGALDFIGSTLSRTANDAQGNLKRMATGMRIVRSADDPAASAVASNLSSRLRSNGRAIRNATEGLAMLEVGDSAAGQIIETLQRMRELAVQAASDTLLDDSRSPLQKEFGTLKDEIERIGDQLTFNGRKLADGSVAKISVQVGINKAGENRISLKLGDYTLATLGLDAPTVEVATSANARTSIDVVDGAIGQVSSSRSVYGALINRVEASIRHAATTSMSLSAAEGRLVDADYAREASALTANRILLYAGQSSRMQAAQMSRSVIHLLR